MAEFVYNRTQAHVTRLKKLRVKGYENLTASEIAEYNGIAALGAYNYTDLNRVESVVKEISTKLGLGLTTKTNWTYTDTPTYTQMKRYIDNVRAIRDACPSETPYPDLPSSMNSLDYSMANNIEKALEIAWGAMGNTDNTTSELGVAELGVMELGG